MHRYLDNTSTSFTCRSARRRGFSLLELLAVITILGILASVVIPRIGGQTQNAKKQCCAQYVGDLNSAIERYYFAEGSWPTQLSDLENNDYYPEVVPPCPVSNTTYTIDSTTHRVLGHNH
jgi:general secretion pathway protein G